MSRIRSGVALAALLTIGGVALANGFGGSDAPPSRIPVPAKPYAATIEDQSGIRIELTEVTFNGEVFIYGLFGQGQSTVPFDRIADVRIEPSAEPEKRVATIRLVDGSTVNLTIEDDILTYGRAKFGNYSIPVEKLRKIEFPK